MQTNYKEITLVRSENDLHIRNLHELKVRAIYLDLFSCYSNDIQIILREQ